MAGTLTITGLAAGLLTGEKVLGPLTDAGSATVGQVTDLTLSTGDNTLVVPAGATHVLIELPASNAITITLRTNLNSSDAGLPIGPKGFVKLPLVPGTTSLILNAAGTTGPLEASFI